MLVTTLLDHKATASPAPSPRRPFGFMTTVWDQLAGPSRATPPGIVQLYDERVPAQGWTLTRQSSQGA